MCAAEITGFICETKRIQRSGYTEPDTKNGIIECCNIHAVKVQLCIGTVTAKRFGNGQNISCFRKNLCRNTTGCIDMQRFFAMASQASRCQTAFSFHGHKPITTKFCKPRRTVSVNTVAHFAADGSMSFREHEAGRSTIVRAALSWGLSRERASMARPGAVPDVYCRLPRSRI